MDTPEEMMDEAGTTLPNPKAVIPNALQDVNVLFMGPVVDGYFQPVPDKVNTPPRWEQGSYSITADKWPPPSLSPNLMDLTPYNGYAIMVMASAWDKEVISQARIFGVLSTMANDVIANFAYDCLQEKEEEIAAYISGISN
ncbi:hypothetical protein [Pontibacter actiniarum]|uniref:Uncharacterized protein n=1 Tax=Pontibacter actiniarum TaxID=323450 RepID=A0A1X9YNY8_9BACT|nr:hypothetical protein [Pontibacter actiniarum]ARS34575.1 hypothetical protein CA264_03460 [Pontibacter actiniarum]